MIEVQWSLDHPIDVAELVCICRPGAGPIANPVKDSMQTKTRETTTRALFVTYVSRRLSGRDQVHSFLGEVASLLLQHAHARTTEIAVLPAGG